MLAVRWRTGHHSRSPSCGAQPAPVDESRFVVIGGSPPAPGEKLTIELMAQDGNELAAYLAKRSGKRKVILWGSSWGSILAVHMAKAHPELFYAYVGTSQVVNSVEAQAASYEKLSQLAVREKDEGSLAVLKQVGSPPWTDPRSFGKVRRIIRKYEARVTFFVEGAHDLLAPPSAISRCGSRLCRRSRGSGPGCGKHPSPLKRLPTRASAATRAGPLE
jgi:pimeloyl-ACP methyl ester carboxylesterase